MESKKIRDDFSFREFLNEIYLPRDMGDDHNLEKKFGYFNQLLKILIANDFPGFFDVIVTKIGRKLMGNEATRTASVCSEMSE